MDSKLTEFAVVDVETTGLHAGGTDRIIEIAVVRTRCDGVVTDEFCSLVNPKRDVGPTHIHGIRAGDVLDAPGFAEIAGDVVALLAGAVFVAHNVPFDARFVRAEMERSDVELPDFPRICTMQLARRVDPTINSRRLACLCAHFDLDLVRAHSARDDARATASLLATCLKRLPESGWPNLVGSILPSEAWPTMPRSGMSLTRSEASHRRARAPSFVAQLVARLPMNRDSESAMLAYEALLDQVLEDRRIDPSERELLEQLAQDSGLTQREATAVHESYLLALLRLALADGVLSEVESEELSDVQRILGIDVEARDRLESRARSLADSIHVPKEAGDLAGKTICFTGAMKCCVHGARAERSLAEETATGAGMIVRSGVSLKLDMLVLADPDSMSGKAKKARELGVRLIAEPVFWRMLGVSPE